MEAGREDVEEHAPDEIGRRQRHGLLARRAGLAVVGVAEAHGAVVEAADAQRADVLRLEERKPREGMLPLRACPRSGRPRADLDPRLRATGARRRRGR